LGQLARFHNRLALRDPLGTETHSDVKPPAGQPLPDFFRRAGKQRAAQNHHLAVPQKGPHLVKDVEH
jgi:hypothetical protein